MAKLSGMKHDEGVTIDITKMNKKAEGPLISNKHPAEVIEDHLKNDPYMGVGHPTEDSNSKTTSQAPVGSLKNIVDSTEPNVITETTAATPVKSGPANLNAKNIIQDVGDILPRRKQETASDDMDLFSKLDEAVEREKKSITERHDAILEKMYEEHVAMENGEVVAYGDNPDENATSNSSSSDDSNYEPDDLPVEEREDISSEDEDDEDDYNPNKDDDHPVEESDNVDDEDDKIYDQVVEPDADLAAKEVDKPEYPYPELPADSEIDEEDPEEDPSDDVYDDEEDIGEDISNIDEDDTADNDVNIGVSTSESDLKNAMRDTNETSEEKVTESEDQYIERIRKELASQVKNQIGSETIKHKIDFNKFTVSNKPVSATKAMKISSRHSGTNADWVLFAAKKSIQASPLSGTEIIGLNRENNTQKTRLNMWKDIFRIIYDHIIDANKPDFEFWLKATRFVDVDHLYFALYRATFNGSNFLHYTCENDKCEKGVFIKDVSFEDMVKYADDKVRKQVENLMHGSDTTTKDDKVDIELEQVSDNYVFGIRSPSIWNVVIETASISQAFLDKYSQMIDMVTYIDSIYLINHKESRLEPIDTKPVSNDVTKTVAHKIRIFNDIIKTLKPDQLYELRSKINSLDSSSTDITYVIPEATCPYCGHKIEERATTAESLLFTRHQLGGFVTL